MVFVVATVGEVDGVDFALAWRHGRCAKSPRAGVTAGAQTSKVAPPECNVQFSQPFSSYSYGPDGWSTISFFYI
jgi:hypothetical protein